MRSQPTPSKFTVIFAAVLSTTIASGFTAVNLANQPTLNEQQDRVLDSAIAIWTMGTTTLFGLLSTRSNDDGGSKDDDSKEEDNKDDDES